MKVLLGANVSASRGGGVATHVRRVAEGLERLGARVDVVWGSPPPPGLPGPLSTLWFSNELWSKAISKDYDVVAAQGGEGALLRAGGPARVVTSHGDEREAWAARLRYAPTPLRQRVVTPLLRVPVFTRAIARAEIVIALHDSEACRFRRERSHPRDTVHVVPNGCGPPQSEVVPRAGNIVFLGDWLPRKGSRVLPAIFRAVRRSDPRAYITLLGPPSSVLSEFHEEDREHVRAYGFLSRDAAQLHLATADLLVMPSYFEGMPLAALEALAFGVPSVGFNIPGIAAAVGASGLLVPPGDIESLACALLRALHDRTLRDRLSREAYARAELLTWASTAERTLAAYEHAASIRSR